MRQEQKERLARFHSHAAVTLAALFSVGTALLVNQAKAEPDPDPDPDPSVCYECRSRGCAPESEDHYTGKQFPVKRCLDFDTTNPPHCCTVWKKQYITVDGGTCYNYDCHACFNPGATCAVATPLPTATPPN